MSGVCFDHADTVLYGENVLHGALFPEISFAEIPNVLRRDPLKGIDIHLVPLERREALLDASDEHFIPCAPYLDVFSGVQQLLHRSLARMHPMRQAWRLHANRVGIAQSHAVLRHLTKLDGSGMVICGMTGRGKTKLLLRCLEALIRHQVLDHPDSELYGWYGLRQVTHLYIDFPCNGSRGALLKRILFELDAVAGTNYSREHEKTVNIDTLQLVVCKALLNHRVALLVIDEKQSDTFSDSPWSLQFVLFYLSLMNLGVSVVLSGNPLAFEYMRGRSQVMRRFSVGGVHELLPGRANDSWWEQDFLPDADEFMLVDGFGCEIGWRRDFQNKHSAGVPGLLVPLNNEAQRSAMRRGGSPCLVLQEDYLAAMRSPRFVELAKIAKAVHGDLTSRYEDLPTLHVASDPKKTNALEIARLDSARADSAAQILKKFQIRVSSDLTRSRKQLKEILGLSEEDVAELGLTTRYVNELKENIAAFERHQQELLARKSSSGKKTGAPAAEAPT